jgi:glutaredoxin
MQPASASNSDSPEDLRLAQCGPRDVTLYTRAGCHLCDEAKAAIAPILSEFGAVLREVNVDEDSILKERHGWDLPVVFIGQHKAAKHRVDLAQFRRQLRDARAD